MPQVHVDAYGFHNVRPAKFQLYYHILNSVLSLKRLNVLEIGVGAGVVAHVLRFNGLHVTTADFDSRLEPDVVCDIRNLPLQDREFDIVLASEVLEHIPWGEVPKAVAEMHRVSREYLVISVPYNQHNLELYGNLKIMKYLYFRGFVNRLLERLFPVRIYIGCPRWRTEIQFDGEHYWEIGYRGFSLRNVRNTLTPASLVEKEFRVPLDPYHYVFILRKQ